MTEQNWLALWQTASQARANGQISRALELFSAALAATPQAGELYSEAANLGSALSANLAGVSKLYAAHCADMGLEYHECPARSRHDRLLRETRYSVVENRLFAIRFDASSRTVRLQAAQALHTVGRDDLAWPHLWGAIQLGPNSYQESLNTAWLLAAIDGIDDASLQCEEFSMRWRSEVAGLLFRINSAEDAAGSLQANTHLRPFDRPDLVEMADHLVELAHMALVLKLPERSKARAVEVLDAASRLAARLPGYGPAYLAVGLAALMAGDARRARRYFATASLVCEQAGLSAEPSGASDRLTMALATARACLTDPSEPSVKQYTAPSVDDRLLKFAHARALRSEGSAFAALDRCGDAVAGYFVRQTPISYEFYKGYKILAHEGQYYAVPRQVHEFTIIDGVVCKPSRAAQYARFSLPRWILDLLRRMGGKWGRATWSLLRTIRRRLYAVPGVKIAKDFESLLASIDRPARVFNI